MSLVAVRDREVVTGTARHVAWGVLPLVAGLFVIVEALNGAGALMLAERGLQWCSALPGVWGKMAAALGVALLSNVVNNLPVGLAAGAALGQPGMSGTINQTMHHAVLVGVDVGPNLSVTGSLATILWLIALRRDGVKVTPWEFLKLGAVVMFPALVGAVLVLR